jgi:ATP-binding protein involved in chromosome partitioning
MTHNEITSQLQKIIYPGLSKSLVDLKVIESITIEKGELEILLAIQNKEAFDLLVPEIISLFKDKFTTVHVTQKAHTKKPLNYGSTSTPNNRAPYAKKIIAVTSGKGGVGKSTVSTNLAVALAQKGYKVGLLDADVYGPDIPKMTGVHEEKLTWNNENKIVPSENFGIKIMSVGLTTPSEDTPLVWRSSVAVSALIQFLEDVAWGELDFMVIDMPPGTGDVQLTMAQELPLTCGVLVTTPQQVALGDVSRAIMMFKDIGVPIGGIIENMSFFVAPDTGVKYDIFGQGGGETLAVRYDIPYLGAIPLEIAIREQCDSGHPAVASDNIKFKEYYHTLCDNLLKRLSL